MNINIKSKYMEQNKSYSYIEFMDVLNASHSAKIERIQLVLKKDNNICFNKVLKLYDSFKIYIDDQEKSLYELTQKYFPLMGNDVNHVDISMNMDLAGNHENKIQSIKIYTNNKESLSDIDLINSLAGGNIID